MKIYDITLPIHDNMLVWWGDPKPHIEVKTTVKSHGVGFSQLSFSSHTGTHIDAPSHFVEKGSNIDMIDLEKLIGPCRVLDLADMFSRHSGDSGLSRGLQNQKKRDSGRGRLGDLARMTYDLEILPEDLVQFSIKKGDRILFKTGNYKLLKQPTFPDSYISLSLKGAEYLLKKGAVLVGTDFLGIEKEKNPGHPVHTALLKAGIVIAEGLDLSEVPEGEYKLICLPLRVSSDGSPVRAVLIKS